MLVRDGKENESFLQALALSRQRIDEGQVVEFDYLGFSLYANQVEAYLSSFKQVKILLFEEIFKDVDHYLPEIYEFIGVYKEYKSDTSIIDNISGEPRYRILYNFLSQPSIIKYPFKRVLSTTIRKKIKSNLIRKSLKKLVLEPNDYNIAIKYFEFDIERLEKIIGGKIKSWVRE